MTSSAAIAQLGERQTEDLKVPGSIPGLGTCYMASYTYAGMNDATADRTWRDIDTSIAVSINSPLFR